MKDFSNLVVSNFSSAIHMCCDWTVCPPFTSVVVIGHGTDNDLYSLGAI